MVIQVIDRLKRIIKPYLFIFPAIIILFLFNIYPAIKVLAMSFYTKYNYLKNIVFELGLDNFKTLLSDQIFYTALKNTMIITIVVVPISITISVLIASLLYKNTKIRNFLRGVYFLPFITSTAAVGVVFRWIFNSKFGLLNYFLDIVGMKPIDWLIDPRYSLIATIILCVWKNLGYNILIFVTALRNVDEDYIRAGKIDGASKREIFRRLIIPLISPSILFVSITSSIGSFKVFQEVYTLFNRSAGPLNSSITIVYYIYDNLMNKYAYGLASAASLVLFIIILIFTLVQFILSKKLVHYE